MFRGRRRLRPPSGQRAQRLATDGFYTRGAWCLLLGKAAPLQTATVKRLLKSDGRRGSLGLSGRGATHAETRLEAGISRRVFSFLRLAHGEWPTSMSVAAVEALGPLAGSRWRTSAHFCESPILRTNFLSANMPISVFTKN